MVCKSCGTPLEQPQTGRRRVYCSSGCKKRSARLKARLRHRFGPVSGTTEPPKKTFRPALRTSRDVSAPALEPLVDGPHYMRTYESFEHYMAANGGPTAPMRDLEAEAALILERHRS